MKESDRYSQDRTSGTGDYFSFEKEKAVKDGHSKRRDNEIPFGQDLSLGRLTSLT